MTKELVFVHGRSQQRKDAVELKADWIDAWRRGLEAAQLDMPLSDDDVRFPYYGDTLYDLLTDVPEDERAEVIIRGEASAGDDADAFARAVITEIAEQAGVTHDDVRDEVDADVQEMGPQNWRWVRAMLQVLDSKVPGASATTISLVTNDVYQYLRNIGFRDEVETGVRAAITPSVPTVVVGHSLGSVVAYNMLRREGDQLGWQVPLFVTVGSPLAVTMIKQTLAPIGHPSCVGRWYNAMDTRDVVSLYPLDAERFAVTPSIHNKVDVDNHTSNRHGIDGYLDDPEVAVAIRAALL